MSESSDPLLAEGKLVTLADETKRRLRFDNRALRSIERKYGSIRKFVDELMRETYFDTVPYALSLAFKVTEDEALDLMDSRQIQGYVMAVNGALLEALGIEVPKAESNGQGEAPSQEKTSQSPGMASTTSPWSPPTSTPSVSGT